MAVESRTWCLPMTQNFDRQRQILVLHGPFIRQLVEFSQMPERRRDLETLLGSAAANGWGELVGVLRKILGGRREVNLLGLDEEDRVIAEAVLRGLQDPRSLPREDERPDPTLAAPGIAAMVQAAASGDARALQLIADMAEQMSKVGGDMGRIAGVIRPLINGERDPDRLCKGMGAQGEQLVLNILQELGRGNVH
jgi:hypothetical protein